MFCFGYVKKTPSYFTSNLFFLYSLTYAKSPNLSFTNDIDYGRYTSVLFSGQKTIFSIMTSHVITQNSLWLRTQLSYLWRDRSCSIHFCHFKTLIRIDKLKFIIQSIHYSTEIDASVYVIISYRYTAWKKFLFLYFWSTLVEVTIWYVRCISSIYYLSICINGLIHIITICTFQYFVFLEPRKRLYTFKKLCLQINSLVVRFKGTEVKLTLSSSYSQKVTYNQSYISRGSR